MRCNPDHHSVNFLRGKRTRMHHIAFEVRDFSAVEHGCDVLSQHQSRSSGDRCAMAQATTCRSTTAIPIST